MLCKQKAGAVGFLRVCVACCGTFPTHLSESGVNSVCIDILDAASAHMRMRGGVAARSIVAAHPFVNRRRRVCAPTPTSGVYIPLYSPCWWWRGGGGGVSPLRCIDGTFNMYGGQHTAYACGVHCDARACAARTAAFPTAQRLAMIYLETQRA